MVQQYVACHAIAFTISICLKKFNMKFSISKYIIKPALATGIMAICSYSIYLMLSE